ncbi:nucleoplasmin-like protein ANO39 isoform X1 [Haliotis rufescens]|uniref:nucleoplasmin-like protein ANO39 isoform X1 n=1 Tax=Haliotis rufescens TaxID=6454 RepID=UPI001EB09656|nr:nucleoplasmin-like protein ANO39 isoform X1 [Haliotis rufescens]
MERDAKEYFWGCQLTKEAPSQTWSFQEEEEDSDYLVHTLFLRNSVLGAEAVKGELNIVQVETKSFEDKDIKQPLFSLRNGGQETMTMDLSFAGACSTTFRLVEGSGPVHIGGQHLVEFPPEHNMSQDESEFFTEDDIEHEDDDDEDDEEDSPKGKKSQKRKASSQTTAKSKVDQKGKMEVSAEDEDDDEDEDEEDMDDDDEEDDDEDDDEEEETPEKTKKKGKKAKEDVKSTKAAKKAKPATKAAVKKTVKKGKK